jgi:hypothetical protein
MPRRPIVVAAVLTLIAGAGALAGQEVFQTPRAGTGAVTVMGMVDIGAMPDVVTRQAGEWMVSVDRMPAVSVSGPEFVRTGVRYLVTWTDGTSERVRVAQVGTGAWVRIEHASGQRWVNLSMARSVEDEQ